MPPVILPTIFPVALRVFSSALALPFGVIEHWRPDQEELRVTVELLRHSTPCCHIRWAERQS